MEHFSAWYWLLLYLHRCNLLRSAENRLALRITWVFDRIDCRHWRNYISARIFDAYYVGLPFFGLAATVCTWLWLKSNFEGIVRIFGVIASAWCVLCAFIFLIFPHFNKIVNNYIRFANGFELAVSFWLLFKESESNRSKPNRVESRSVQHRRGCRCFFSSMK